jgi:hypothetical protein
MDDEAIFRFLLRFRHYWCFPRNRAACRYSSSNRDTCWPKGTNSGSSTLRFLRLNVVKWWWACEPVYVLANMALKFSIGIFLLRIAVARIHRVIIWTTIGVVEIYGAFYFFLFVLQCRPSAYFWTQYTGGKGTCINPKITVDATYAYSAVSCIADWTLGIIPIFLVWNLRMQRRMKYTVAMILGVGAM